MSNSGLPFYLGDSEVWNLGLPFNLATMKNGIWGYRFTLAMIYLWNLGLAVLPGNW